MNHFTPSGGLSHQLVSTALLLSFTISAFFAPFLLALAASTGVTVSPSTLTAEVDEKVNFVASALFTEVVTPGTYISLTDNGGGGVFYSGTIGGACNSNTAVSQLAIGQNKGVCYKNSTPGTYVLAVTLLDSSAGNPIGEPAVVTVIVAAPDVVVDDPEEVVLITVCHASVGTAHAYTKEMVGSLDIKSGAFLGSGLHDNDIIPPFSGFAGHNWTASNQLIYENNCVVPILPEDPVEEEEDPEPTTCTVTIVSDETNTVVEKDNAFAKLITWFHPSWQAVVAAPSRWIWGDNPVVDPVIETTLTFQKGFGWNGPVTDATLIIAADNSYQAFVNGELAGADAGEFNYVAAGVDTYDVTDVIEQGNNLLSITVKNFAQTGATAETNPAGLKYTLVVEGTDEDCDIPYEEPVLETTGTVTLCKVDEAAVPQSEWTLALLGKKLETVIVPANNPAGVNTTAVLSAYTPYVALVSGIWNNNRGPLNLVDAEYSTEDNWVTVMDGFTGVGTEILELSINDAVDPNSTWGAYSSSHTYLQAFTQGTGTAKFSIKDSYYGDNTGSLTAEVYEGYAGKTGANGCVTFTSVPYGEYQIAEVMQVGWENVSGLGEFTVAAPFATSTITNKRQSSTNPDDERATIVAHKVVCTNEADLPNWGLGGPNITATTASAWVASHGSCRLEPGVSFEWAPATATNPDTALPGSGFYGAAGGVWTKFGPTSGTGETSTTLTSALIGAQSHVWVREVLPTGYIPFTYGPNNATNTNPVSAEMYCHTDVKNYDNYDRVDGITTKNTYHCVAFNHQIEPTEEPEEPPLSCQSEVNLITNGGFESEVVTDSSLWQRFAAVLGWKVTRRSNDLATTLELHRGWSGNQAAAGLQYAELDGDHSTVVTQLVPTIPGAEYTLSWAFAGRHALPADQNQLAVLVDGSLVAQNGPALGFAPLIPTDWSTQSYTFTAATSVTAVSFRDDGASDSLGTFLDAVSLYCVEPEEDGEDGDVDGDGDNNDSAGFSGRSSSNSNSTLTRREGRVAGATTTAETELGQGGDFPPTGLVLGEQTSVVPYGAPNAGHGGARQTENRYLLFGTLVFMLLAYLQLRRSEASALK